VAKTSDTKTSRLGTAAVITILARITHDDTHSDAAADMHSYIFSFSVQL